MDKITIVIVAITIIVFGGIIGLAVNNQRNFQPRNQCVQHSVSLSMHIHPVLSLFVDDKPVAISANIGIDPACMKAIHTHDESGTIHVEYPTEQEFTLGDFFANWNQPFNSAQLMDKVLDETHELTMKVDGQNNTELEKLILKDEQKIEIRYKAK